MKEKSSRTGLEIAIIGMAGKFPGAKNIHEFWENLKNGVETISFFSDEEMEKEASDPTQIRKPNYVKSKGIIEDIEYFDESFFNFTPAEAQVIDPQTRIFLEISWEALEQAGYAGDTYKGKIGVYAGTNNNFYWNTLMTFKDLALGGLLKGVLGSKDYLTMLTSYKLDLKGPSMSIFTACSTSLVAIDLAFRALLTGECDMALAGGVTATLPQKVGYHYQEGMLLSKDGHCRTFDAKSSGTVFGQGAGVVVLKPLEPAITDGDYLWAVIRSSAVCNDGMDKVGITAPTVEGQAAAARNALHLAEVTPESISYMEAHGTATILGDPIEIEGLTRALNTQKKGFCRIGSVKTNVGHLDCASGISGFIKTVLSLKHRLIPPSLHFDTVNPKIDFENSPFYMNTQLVEWKNEKYPLRAGVNSLGIGGTNAHIIIEEAPEIEPGTQTRTWKLILFSAKTGSALSKISENFVEYLKENPGINLADAAYTLQVGKRVFGHKKMLVCANVDETIDALTSADPKKVSTSFTSDDIRPIVFLFPGQGSQYVNMGLELYRKEPVFRAEMDRCFEILKPLVDYDIKEILYPGNSVSESSKVSGVSRDSSHGSVQTTGTEGSPLERGTPDPRKGGGVFNINQTEITQPVLFILQYALAKLLMEWGISPYAMIGHSIGEYVAACLSGVFSLEEALEVVVLRGKLMQEMPGGAMLSVSTSEAELTPLLNENEDISLAAVNGVSYCVVSGPNEAIDHFSKQLAEKEIKNKKLYTSHAFHSKMMDPVLERFEEKLKTVTFNRPVLPYISNLTGNWITVEDAVSPEYWSKHLRQTVRFNDGLVELLKEENALFVEVGPGRVLSTLVIQHPDKKTSHSILNLVRHPKENIADDKYLLEKIGQLWLLGQKIDWSAFYRGTKVSRLPLPTYPFEKNRFWFEENPFKLVQSLFSQERLGKNPDISQWFYVPSWKSTTLPVVAEDYEFSCYLLFTDELDIGTGLSSRLERFGNDVIMVRPGEAFAREGTQGYLINPGNADDYDTLFNEIRKEARMPNTIVHLWNVTDDGKGPADLEWETVEKLQDIGYYSLLYMLQAIGKKNYLDEIRIIVVSTNMFDVLGDNRVNPGKSTLLGPLRTMSREYPNISCSGVDIFLPDPGSQEKEKLIDRLYKEISSNTDDEIIAYRKNIRWVQDFEQVHWEKSEDAPRLKSEGVYLITGGLGGIGFVIAEYIALSVGAKLVLIGRSSLPARENWEAWLDTHTGEDTVSTKIKKVLELEEKGAEVIVASVNVADDEQMREVISNTLERFGRIDGVIHCAGVNDYGGIMQRRTKEASDRILEPKVKGTLVLDRVLKDIDLDFFVLCSSVNSILAPFGIVTYNAANAFLDAFAHFNSNRNPNTFTVSINWDLWEEVGMVVDMQKKAIPMEVSTPQTKEVNHPLFDKCIVTPQGDEIYETIFNISKYWVINEHKVMGNPVLVGTAYLEMARAAFENHTGVGTLEIRNLYFLNPLLVVENKEVQFRMVLRKKEDIFEFYFMSRVYPNKGQWRAHVRGEMAPIENEPPQRYSIEEIKARCSKKEVTRSPDDYKPFEGFIGVGRRWNCKRRAYLGENQGLLEFELLEEYKDDMNAYPLHPALLDVSTSFSMGLIATKVDENYLPFFYKKLRVKGPLPRKGLSYTRYIESDQSQEDKLKRKFDITIMDEDGTERVDIEEYTLLSVSEAGTAAANETRKAFPLSPFLSPEDADPNLSLDANPMKFPFGNENKASMPAGILSSEGVEAFCRVLGGTQSQVVVSSKKFMSLLQLIRNPPVKKEENLTARGVRPELSTAYVAPASKVEEMLAAIFISYLGIVQIGIHDDLFALGLDSLKAVDIMGKISGQFNVDISVGELFNFPTIGEIAKYIEDRKKNSNDIEIEAAVEEDTGEKSRALESANQNG
jgi:acyl transferase domain-containing protein/acyl carrier protein